ncbi:MAG TPA: DUF6111 family protein [Rhizomicrobium sp.]|jgi:hypothetical protein|nr:DUF6111 family protein [Rhizomicrobium sp.]
MTRVLAIRALLFAVPFAIYGLYLILLRYRKVERPETPWPQLFVAGLALVAASFVYLGLTEGETTSGHYVAPKVVDGRIVPGHVESGNP